MSRAAARPPAGPADERAAALELLARIRRALAEPDLTELVRLLPPLEALRGRLEVAPQSDPEQRRRERLALLDEARRLADLLRIERRRLAAQLRESGSHRRAGAAYRRAGRL